MGLYSKCKFHRNEHPDKICPRHYAIKNGPDRVIVGRDGDAVPAKRAYEEYGIVPTVILLRYDGWTLGAPEPFVSVATNLWRGDWIGIARAPFTDFEPI